MLFLKMIMFIYMMSGVVVFCSTRKHLLLSLLSLEFIMLSIYFTLFTTLLIYGYEMYFILIFLVFSVCEGALGLSILVCLVRSHGNDYLTSVSCLSW